MQPAMSSPVPTVTAVVDAFAEVAECMQSLRRLPQSRIALIGSEYAIARRQWLEGMLGRQSYFAVLDTLIEKIKIEKTKTIECAVWLASCVPPPALPRISSACVETNSKS